MSQQLALFVPAEAVTAVVVAEPAPKARRNASRLPADFSLEESGEYYTVRHHEEWIGSLRHLGGKVWNLYFPNERGVCGFGGPDKAGAVAELHKLHLVKQPAHKPVDYTAFDDGYEEGGFLHTGMRGVAHIWPLEKLREMVARFTAAMEDGHAGGIQKMREQKLPEQVIERRTANVARLLSIMAEVLTEREATA